MMTTHGFRWLVVAIVLLSCASYVSAQTPDDSEGIYEEVVSEGVEAMKQAARLWSPVLAQIPGSSFVDIDEFDDELDEIQKEALAAVKRIKVCPEAEKAGRAIACGDFAGAVELCRKAIKANPKDAYSLYLCGMAELEQEHYVEAAACFRSVTKPEPQSRTSFLLAEYAEAISKAKRPISDETIMLCYDEAKGAVEKRFPPKAESGSFFMRPPPLARDPLLYKLEAEGLEGRGPLVANTKALVEAALKLDDTYSLLAVALFFGEDESITGPIWRRLRKPHHATVVEGIMFLREFYGDEKYCREAPPEFIPALEKLQKLEPDEGLWLLLSVPYKEPREVLDPIPLPEPVPLTDEELNLVERAVNAKRFTLPEVELQQGLDRVCREIGFPYQVTLRSATTGFSLYSEVRSIGVERMQETSKAALKRGDQKSAERALALMQRGGVFFVPRGVKAPNGIRGIIKDNIEQKAAELAMEVKQPTGKDWVRMCARVRLGDIICAVRNQTCVDGLPLRIPVSSLRRADGAVMVSPLTEWNIRRAVRFANTPESLAEAKQLLSRSLAWCQDGQGARADTLVTVGVRKQKSLAPILRDFSKCKLDDQALAALIWATGELQDKAQTDWLKGLEKDQRSWVVILAGEALEKINGEAPVGRFE